MLNIDLTGRRALVAGVADDGGFGFAIAKALAEAGASVSVGTWPPALNIFTNLLERGKMDESRRLSNGDLLQFERIYPLDAAFDTLADAPEEVKSNKRYKDTGDFSIDGLVARIISDFGEKGLDIVVHSLANGPEVKKPLLETSRNGYLAALGVSAYSLVSMCLAIRMTPSSQAAGRLICVPHVHGERKGHTWLWRWNVICESRARERYPYSRIRSRPQIWRACERHLCRSLCITCGKRDRHHRANGRLLRKEFPPAWSSLR